MRSWPRTTTVEITKEAEAEPEAATEADVAGAREDREVGTSWETSWCGR